MGRNMRWLVVFVLQVLQIYCQSTLNLPLIENQAKEYVAAGQGLKVIELISPLLESGSVAISPTLRIQLARGYTLLQDNENAEKVLRDLLVVFPESLEGTVALSKVNTSKYDSSIHK